MKLMLHKAYSVTSDASKAEDACQEAFVRIIRNIDKIGDVTEARTAALCALIARNAAVDLYRRTAREIPAAEIYGSTREAEGALTDTGPPDAGQAGDGPQGDHPGRRRPEPSGNEPYDRLEQKEAVRELASHIRALPESYREVLELRCLHHMSAAETARLLGTTENTVNIRLTRARKLLKERLDGA